MRGLYAIVDVDRCTRLGLDPERSAEAMLAARPAALQLRDKRGWAGATLALLRRLVPRCRAYAVPLFANDRADLGALADCDGVHLGPHDLPARAARRLFAERAGHAVRIGVSAHDTDELEQALGERPDYVALGPVFATDSKSDAAPVIGPDGLARLAERTRAAGVPVVAIGGIDAARARSLAPICRCCAVIGALMPAPGSTENPYEQIERRAAELARQLSSSPP